MQSLLLIDEKIKYLKMFCNVLCNLVTKVKNLWRYLNEGKSLRKRDLVLYICRLVEVSPQSVSVKVLKKGNMNQLEKKNKERKNKGSIDKNV